MEGLPMARCTNRWCPSLLLYFLYFLDLDIPYAAVESASEDEPSSCARISRSVTINSSRET